MNDPLFLKVKSGDAVLYKKNQIGKVLTLIGGSRETDAPTFFQIANIDSGEIIWIDGEEVKGIVSEYRTKIKILSSFDYLCLQFCVTFLVNRLKGKSREGCVCIKSC